MKLAHISYIEIPDYRVRREFDAETLASLAESIATSGLMHAPVLRNDGKTLVAGERRLRAMKQLHNNRRPFRYEGEIVPINEIPVSFLGDLSHDELIEAELSENVLREDITWQEKAAAYAELHKLRSSQNPDHTLQATSDEIAGKENSSSYTRTQVRDALVLQDHMDDPAVAKAASQKEAMKVVRRKKEADYRQTLGELFGSSSSEHTLIEGDCRDELPKLEAGRFACVVTDPPYGISMKNCGQALRQHNYDDSLENFEELMADVVAQLTRLCTDAAHAYLFCDIDGFHFLRELFITNGWQTWRTPLIWSKGNIGMLPAPDYGPRRTHELILYAYRGGRKVQRTAAHDVIDIPQERNLVHAAQKPTALYRELLSRSVLPGDEVLDPFAGRGTIFPAATAEGVKATGVELDAGEARATLADAGGAAGGGG